MDVIAFSIFKGGAGKTTSAGYAAAYLAQALAERAGIPPAGAAAASGRSGARVLALDLDHQSHLSRWMLSEEGFQALDHDLLPALVEGRPLVDLIVPTLWPGVDLAPASPNLSAIEVMMAGLTMREARLRRALAGVAKLYDYVVIDCPPSGGLVMQNALGAGGAGESHETEDGEKREGWILVPVEAGNFSLAGLSDFVQWVEVMRREGVHNADWLGLLPTQFDAKTTIAKDMLAILRKVSDMLGGVRILPAIPYRTAQEQMVAAATVATERISARTGLRPLAQAYRYAADHILQTVGAPPALNGGNRGKDS